MQSANLFHKFELYVPATYAESMKKALAGAGAGRLGNYSECFWQCRGTGQFRPLSGSNPFAGEAGKPARVDEIKLEFVVPADKVKEVVAALKLAHPYETPAFAHWPVELE